MAFIHGTNNIITNGLVFYQDAANKQTYPGSGTNSYDISGQSNNGTFVNNTTFSTDNGGCFQFDGTDDYITCGTDSSIRPNETTLNANGFTIILNFRTDNNTVFQGLFSNDGVGQSTYYGLEANFNGGSSKFVMSKLDGQGIGSQDRSTALTAAVTVNNNQWYHVAFNFVNANKSSYLIYIDGVAQSMTTSGTGTSVGYSPSAQAAIGASRNHDLDGQIARVLCYNRTLSAAEILQDYNAVKLRFK